jgi:hypothetical protein
MAEGAEMKGAAAAILAIILHTGIACSKIAHAAGPFDGEWKGATARIMHKCDSWDLAATIVDGKVNMTITSHTNKDSVSGRVEPDGTFSGGHWEGKFTADRAIGITHSQMCGDVSFTLSKVK